VLDLAVLGLLKEKPMAGYELRKQLEARLGRSFSPGSLYPTLKALARREAIEKTEGSGTSLRDKKVYRITAEGDALFERLVDEPGRHVTEDREAFMVRWAFFRYTRPETRRSLLERRRGYLLEHLDRIKTSLRNLRERVDNYSLELMRYGESETEREIHWLDLQLEAELAPKRAEDKAQKRAARKAAKEGERTARKAARKPRAHTSAARKPHTKTIEGPTALQPTRPATGSG
jgi:DNA-binding PadR family transcriptional regulator